MLASPTDANTLFIGGVNGGIWVSHNAGVSWTPLTDNLSSLSIASLSYNATNSQILYAGLGITSNGSVGGNGGIATRGGFQDGILVSNDGGATWSVMSTTLTSSLIGKSVVSVEGNGTTVLAATAEPWDATQLGAQGYGLYRSVAGGAFTLVTGLPSGAATALVGSGTAANPYYVSINTGGVGGVYRSVDNGATWTAATTIAAGQIGRLATAANGAVVLATYNATGGTLASLQLSQNGSTWVSLALPPVINGGQAATNLALAIDPTNSNVVYLAGDTGTSPPYTATAYRIVLDPSTGQSSITSLTDSGTADDSSAHADSRNFAFDMNGRLILVGDGGVYARTDPLSSDGTWTGLNNGLALRESYGVAFDAISKRLLVSAQDNGVAVQLQPRGQTFTPLASGDGVNVAINDRTYAASKESVQYYTTQNLSGLTRQVVDATGAILSSSLLLGTATATNPVWNFVNVDANHTDFTEAGDPDSDGGPSPGKQLPFSSRFVLNRNDPTKIAIGTNYLYVTTDALISDSTNTAPLTNLGDNNALGGVTALAYGTNDNVNAILAGVNGAAGARLVYGTTATAGSLQTLGSYTGDVPTGVVFDARSAARFFVSDYTALWGTTNGGASFTDLTSNLTALNIARPTSVEFISNNGVNALLVGGLAANSSAQSPIAVAMSDSTGALSGWAAFGRGLPNTIVNLLSYNPSADVLAVGLWGRGIWTLYDVTSYFSTASVLQYGLADNDSAPDASFLTGNRPLIKYGAGTLTISGTASYTGSTTVNDGTLLANGSLASSSNLLIEQAGTVAGTGTLPQTTVNGTLAPGNNAIGTLTVNNGLTFNSGSLYQVMASTTAASATNVGGGTAALGGTVEALLQPGSYLPRRSFTILTATGGTTGTFAGVTSNYPFLRPQLIYDGTDVTLSVTPGGFAAGAQTPNQAGVGAALDASVATASGDFATVINAFSLLTASQAPAAFEAISGQNYSGFSTVGVQTAQLFMTNFAQQAGTGSTTSGTAGRIALADACDFDCDVPQYHWSAWGGALGGVGTVAGSASASGLNFGIGGFAAGLDRRFDSGLVLGVTAGYASATESMQTMPGSGSSNTAQGGLYGSWSTGALYVDALMGYARSESQMLRPISIPGLAPRTANGRTHADQYFGQLESGNRFELGGSLGSFVTPFARLQGSTATQAGFTESGADSLDLTVAPQTTNSLRSVLGSQLGGAADLGWREKLGLVFRLGWSHEYADTSRPVNASFAGAPASPFVVAGAEAPRDGAILGLAASTAIAEATSVYLRYDGELAGGNTSHIFSGGVRISW